MNDSFTLKRILRLSIEQTNNHLFSIHAKDAYDRPIDLTDLKSHLFFNDEFTFYGLLVETSGTSLQVKASQLLQAFSKKHPYTQFEGIDEDDKKLLTAIQEAANIWQNSSLWEYVRSDQTGISFDIEGMDVSKNIAKILQTAIQEKLTDAAIDRERLPSLLPFLRKYGWPEPSSSNLPIRVALRLTEPEEENESDSDWLLETIVIGARGRHWTPAIRKRKEIIEDALPARWKAYAKSIQEKQEEMMSLLSSITQQSPRSFLFSPMQDVDVRLFIQDDLPILQSFGYPVILPAWLKSITESKMHIHTSASMQSYNSTTGLDEVLSFDWNFSLAGKKIDRTTFQKLVDENREYIRAGDEWFHIDPLWLQKIKELMDRADAGEWTVKDLLLQEIPKEIVSFDESDELEQDPLTQFTMQKSLRNYMEALSEKKELPSAGIPRQLQAQLRPYQEDGYNWLIFMRDNGFGSCLADDMGLGKTIQLITYLLNIHGRKDTTVPSLIVCPTSVLGNWQKEIEKFSPSLNVHIHYGSMRSKDEQFEAMMNQIKPDVILTTYGTASQDSEMLAQIEFASITLDEAQNIKNIQTKQSRAIRSLKGQHHIALTGTPIENRLSELWAIFDFIHRGYFGSFNHFSEQFIVPIERDQSEREKRILRTKIRPFLLRRTKNDEDLLLNLPKKLEQNEYCPLTTEQAALYESFIDETKEKLETLAGFERKGLILTMLNRLKQLCNHPSLFLKEPIEPAETSIQRSDKLKSIITMAANIVENDEQCIIFTQYIGMGELIQQCLSELYDIDAPFLTGSMAKGRRDELVDSFQNREFPVFILSLRAGGTGLNLTAANHVLHADRWWNPAVENQATDRAYRIGQTKFVHVHKFVTIGTIEEKIDQLLEEKSTLSADLIQSSDWLTDLSDDELDDLLSFN